MALKSKAELEARKKFVAEADKQELWSNADLAKMSVEQIEERWESIGNQYLLQAWIMAMYLRDKFESDKKFGQYVKTLRERNPEHPLCAVKRLDRYILAGRFCKRYRITDLKKSKIIPTSIYYLSEPRNQEFAGNVLTKITGGNVPSSDVARMIEQKKSVLSVEKEETIQTPDLIDYETPKRTDLRIVPVVKGIAIEQDEEDKLDRIFKQVELEFINEISPPASLESLQRLVGIEPEKEEVEESKEKPVWDGLDRRKKKHHDVNLSSADDDDLLLELSLRTIQDASEQRIISDIILFSERYDKSFSELVKIFQGCMKAAQKLCAI